MADPVLSTLSEINRELHDRMFELLNFCFPSAWNNPSQVIYSPSDDLDFATQLYQIQNGSANSIKLPFAFYTRYTGEFASRTYDHSLRPWADNMAQSPKEMGLT